ncbi:helix-turn-helix transcriptional regulator [Pseudoflavonifractor phocaeensis]|nr:helix-turn-helix transcriptional regulator [Pseudoflavonifractor phocaeensis]
MITTILTRQNSPRHIVKSYTSEVRIVVEQADFINRLVELRLDKGVSARDMSLSIGQSAGYINNIENGVNYPSMAVFFYICDYLGVTPKEFFDTESKSPTRVQALLNAAKDLSSEQLEHLIAIAKGLNK